MIKHQKLSFKLRPVIIKYKNTTDFKQIWLATNIDYLESLEWKGCGMECWIVFIAKNTYMKLFISAINSQISVLDF